MKKILSYLLIFVILVSGVFYTEPIEIKAKTTVDSFDLNIYRANEYLKKGSVCNNIIKNILKDDNLPSQVIVRELNSKNFEKAVTQWELAHWVDKSPYEIVQGEIDKKGYYEAILLSIFISESQMDNSLFDMGKTVSAETNQVLSSVKSWVKKSDEIGMHTIEGNQKISKLTTSQKKSLKKYLSDTFKKQHPLLDKSEDVAGVFNDVFSSVDTVYDAVNKMAYYTNVCEISNQSKNLIRLMYKDCPKSNLAMKEALRELEVSLDEFNSGVKDEIQAVMIDQSSEVLSALADAGWEKVININPYVAAFSFGGKIGTKIGDNICNTLFSTDKTIEQYEKMKCLGEFYSLLSSSAQKLGKIYSKKKTTENAKNYIAAIDALFSTANMSCNFGTEYANILYKDAALGWIAISNHSYSKFLSEVKSIQKTYLNEQKSLVKNFLVSLKEDYPSIYKTIILGQNNKNSESKVQKDSEKEKKKEQTKEKTISSKDQKTWGKAYIKAMNEWEKQVKQWEKDHKTHMPESMKNRAEAALIQITSDGVPQLVYYFGSSVAVFNYQNGRVTHFGRVSWQEDHKIDFYYAPQKGKGYLVDMTTRGEERIVYSFTKYGCDLIFDGADMKGTCYVYPFGEEQRQVESLNVEQYYKRFNQVSGNVKYRNVDETEIISVKAMKKKLGDK